VAGVELLNLSKRFGAAAVIENLSLSIGENELVAFLGPSGCGKTTLLRLIAGLETLDAGEIHIGGRRVDALAPGERGVAMVFQHYALYPHMTVRENLAFGLENARVPAAEIARRITEAASMLEIAALLDRKPGSLSGGERQRVAIGRAIVKAPKLFLLDEPMSNLDTALRLRTRFELAQLRKRVHAAMIFVTHDQVEAMTLADRIVVMSRKGVEQVGEPMEIYARPATSFVAGFVGAPKINFLPGQFVSDGGAFAKVKLANSVVVETRVPARALPSAATFDLALRPDAISVVEPGNGAVDAVVDVVERLGDRTYVYARSPLDGERIVAEATGTTRLGLGDAIGLKIDGAAAHLFDAQGRGHHAAA
jgi:multiple sugar transport system ATP-binding protein